MAFLTFADKLPASLQAAVEEFKEGYLAAQAVEPKPEWYSEFGDVGSTASNAITTYPITSIAAQYTRQMGDIAFEKFAQGIVQLRQERFVSAYEIDAVKLYNDNITYSKFQQLPEQWIIAEQKHVAKNITWLLDNGESLELPWEGGGTALFDDSHPVNIGVPAKGVFSNYNSVATAITIDNIKAEVDAMLSAVKDPTGESYPYEPDTILVPSAKYLSTKWLVEQQLVVSGGSTVSNPLVGMRVVHASGLTNSKDWYLVNSGLAKLLPCWIALKWTPNGVNPVAEKLDEFKETLEIASKIWYAFGVVFPHAIRKIKGT